MKKQQKTQKALNLCYESYDFRAFRVFCCEF